MGSVGNSNTSIESVNDFLNRAVNDNDRIIIEANDMESLVGTKAEVQQSSRFKTLFGNMYFGRFRIVGNDIVITATNQSDVAERLKKR